MLPKDRERLCDFCKILGTNRRVVYSSTTGKKALACASCPNPNEECPECADECPEEVTAATSEKESEASKQIVSALRAAVSDSNLKISYMAPSGKMHKIQ